MGRQMLRAQIAPLFLVFALGTAACALDPTELEPYREVSCFEASKVSLRDAVEAAEVEGGRAIDGVYRQVCELGCLNRDPGYYDVTVLIVGKLSRVSVDAGSQQIRARNSDVTGRSWAGELFERIVHGTSDSRIPAAERTSIHLHDAIASAEKQGGKAMEARIEMKNGTPGFSIGLVEHGRLRTTWIDGG
jgi:hypothetical protein